MCVHMFNKKKLACLCAHVYMSVYSLTAEGFSFQKAISEKNKFVSSSYRLRWCSHGKKKVKGERSSANTWINEVSYELSLLVPYVRVREGLANTSPVAGEQKGTSPNQEIMHSQWYNNGLTQTDRQTDRPTPSLAPSLLPSLPFLHLLCLIPSWLCRSSFHSKPWYKSAKPYRSPVGNAAPRAAGCCCFLFHTRNNKHHKMLFLLFFFSHSGVRKCMKSSSFNGERQDYDQGEIKL